MSGSFTDRFIFGVDSGYTVTHVTGSHGAGVLTLHDGSVSTGLWAEPSLTVGPGEVQLTNPRVELDAAVATVKIEDIFLPYLPGDPFDFPVGEVWVGPSTDETDGASTVLLARQQAGAVALVGGVWVGTARPGTTRLPSAGAIAAPAWGGPLWLRYTQTPTQRIASLYTADPAGGAQPVLSHSEPRFEDTGERPCSLFISSPDWGPGGFGEQPYPLVVSEWSYEPYSGNPGKLDVGQPGAGGIILRGHR